MEFNEALAEAMADEITRLKVEDRDCLMAIEPEVLFQLVAAVQLAQRHPNLPANVRLTTETFVENVGIWFMERDCPTVVAAIMAGDRRDDDQEESRIILTDGGL